MRRLATAVLLVLAAPGLSAQAVVTEGKRVVVRSSAASKVVAERTRDALEAAIPLYEKHLPYKMGDREKLVVNLYDTPGQYAAAVTEAGASAFAGNQAATVHKNRETYVVIQPRCDAAYLELVGGLPELTRWLVCHEGVHQWVLRAGSPTAEGWPFWYAEGAADHIAEACLRADDKNRVIPCFETRRRNVAAWLAEGRLPTLSRILTAEIDATTAASPLYACAQSFYDFLATDPGRVAKLHSEVRRLGGIASSDPIAQARDRARAFATVFAAACGSADELEKPWREEIRKQKAAWWEAERSSQFVKDDIVCAGSGTNNAALISTLRAGRDPSIAFEVNVLDFGAKQADVYFAFDAWDTRFFKIGIGAKGYASLLVFDRGWRPELQKNADVAIGILGSGIWIPMRVEVEKDRIRVTAGGKTVLECTVPAGFDVAGSWGIGACSASVVRFRKLALNGKEVR